MLRGESFSYVRRGHAAPGGEDVITTSPLLCRPLLPSRLIVHPTRFPLLPQDRTPSTLVLANSKTSSYNTLSYNDIIVIGRRSSFPVLWATP